MANGVTGYAGQVGRRAGAHGRPDALLRACAEGRPLHHQELLEGDLAPVGRGHAGFRCARCHRWHDRRRRVDVLLHRHGGRHPGLRRPRPARHRRPHRVRVRVLQHPRDLPDRGRHRVGRHGWLRIHCAARRHAHLGRGRRPRGHGDPVDAVPGDHARAGWSRRDHPAVHRRACCPRTSPPGW